MQLLTDRYLDGRRMPVLVIFQADGCRPCRQLAPALDHLASQRFDIRIARVAASSAARLVQQFRIRDIPTGLLLRRGLQAARISRAVPAPQIHAWLNDELHRMPPLESRT